MLLGAVPQCCGTLRAVIPETRPEPATRRVPARSVTSVIALERPWGHLIPESPFFNARSAPAGEGGQP